MDVDTIELWKERVRELHGSSVDTHTINLLFQRFIKPVYEVSYKLQQK